MDNYGRCLCQSTGGKHPIELQSYSFVSSVSVVRKSCPGYSGATQLSTSLLSEAVGKNVSRRASGGFFGAKVAV